MDALVAKRLKAREQEVEVGGHRYTLRRPTMLQRINHKGLDLIRACVVGWDLNLIDLIPGGDPTPAPFTPEVWSDWLDDTPTIWNPLDEALIALIERHETAMEDAEKN